MWKRLGAVATIAIAAALVAACSGQQAQQPKQQTKTTKPSATSGQTTSAVKAPVEATGTPYTVKLDPNDFVSGVTNPYWPLKVGTHWVYRTTTADGVEKNDVVVTDQTKTILGIKAVVVHDTVTVDGSLTEDTFDWYAQEKDGTVWYLGEDTKELENGKVTSTAGTWEAGVNGAQPGVIMQANPKAISTPSPWYWQEFYKDQAEDQARTLSVTGTATVPAGTYNGLLVTEERSPIEPTVVEQKYYLPGLGVVLERTTKGAREVSVLVSRTQQ